VENTVVGRTHCGHLVLETLGRFMSILYYRMPWKNFKRIVDPFVPSICAWEPVL
ncbi:MAG: hypothetical protein ACI9UK_000918, partial [Candidatus Krumholzibacteriia bacterium]